jgi:hypothetical protein
MKLDLQCEIQQSIITGGRDSLQQKPSGVSLQLFKTFLFSAVQCSVVFMFYSTAKENEQSENTSDGELYIMHVFQLLNGEPKSENL